MLFNSLEFLLFLPIVFVLYWFVFNKSLKWQNALVLVASYFFYGWWSWKFMGLLMLSTLLDYSYGFWVASPNKKKAKTFLWLSIINNLGILGAFKYYNFFATQFQVAFESIGLHTNPVLLNVALPVGISFYTFHGMSYVFDIYRGHQKPVSSFIDYAVFVSFFPLLVAGPIERANHLLPQVQRNRSFNSDIAIDGFGLAVWGMFKKVAIADNLAPAVNDIFSNYNNLSGLTLILGAVYFSFQIYCDFSGYSDIARGIAKLFGFELLLNFNNPYISRSIPEFWKKWHISLSSWFRDYVYFPLGGSRVGLVNSIINVLIVFVLSAFWHGANYTYVVWGLIHAFFYIPGFVTRKLNKRALEETKNRVLSSFQIISTFLIVTVAWVFFRSPSVSTAWVYIKNCMYNLSQIADFIGWRSQTTEGSHVEFLFILILFGIVWQLRKMPNSPWTISLISIFTVLFGMFIQASDFIYFQF